MKYKITVSKDFDRLKFAKWALKLKYFSHAMSVPIALKMADDLMRGCEFEEYLSNEEKIAGDAVCTITEIVYVDPYTEHFKVQSEYFALRDRGAAGDAEAAIAYCKLEVQGLVSHGAMG